MLTPKLSITAAVLGTLVVVAHAFLAIGAVLTLSEWLTGTAIGVVLILAGLLHFVAFRRLVAAHGRHSDDGQGH